MDVIYLFRSLLEKKWIILITGILAATVAYFLTQNTPKKFRSISQISTGFTISDRIKVGNEDFNLYEADVKFNNAITTLTSPSVVSYLSYLLILHDLESKTPFRQLTESQKNSAVYTQLNKAEAIKTFRQKLDSMSLLTSFKEEERKLIELLSLYGYDYKSLSKALNVYRVQRTDYVQIDFVSENPELSAFVVNNLFDEFISYYKKIRSTTSQESVDTLKSMMEKKKLDLDYKKALLGGGSAVDNTVQSSSTLELVSSFEQSLEQEKNRLATLYAESRKVDQRLESLGVKVTGTRSSSNNEELLILRTAMNEAYAAYLKSEPKNPDLLAKYNRLKDEYQQKISESNNAPVTTERPTQSKEELLLKKKDLEIDIQTSTSSIAALQVKIRNLRGAVYSSAARGASAETLEKEIEQANNEYLLARQKFNDAMDMSSSSVNNFRQILPGQPAINPEPSKRFILIALAGLSAIVTSMLIITLIFYFDSSVKTPNIFAKTVGLKLISMVNFMNLKNKPLAEIVAVADKDQPRRYKDNHNIFRESLRKLRYEIENSGKKTILFASTKKHQGKTTLIMGLSYSLSLSKNKILIIDTNFSNNDLTVEMGGTPILEKLAFSTTSGVSVYDHVIKNSVDVGNGSVFIIGSKGGDYTPAEILPKENILQHLDELKNHFDYIFLEGPPLNDFSDAKELSQYVEGVIGVFSANDMIKQMDKEAINFFKSMGDKYMGSILNMVDLKNVDVA